MIKKFLVKMEFLVKYRNFEKKSILSTEFFISISAFSENLLRKIGKVIKIIFLGTGRIASLQRKIICFLPFTSSLIQTNQEIQKKEIQKRKRKSGNACFIFNGFVYSGTQSRCGRGEPRNLGFVFFLLFKIII